MIFFGAIASSRGDSIPSPPGKTYVDIPSPPTFSNTHTLIQSTTGNSIQLVDTNGKTDLLIGSNYPFLQLNGLTASYRIKSLNSTDPTTWVICGGAGNAAALDCAVSTPNVEYYNVRLRDSNNCIKMTPETGTALPLKDQLYQNIIVEGALFGGILVNQSISGKNYGNMTINFYRGLRAGGEPIYAGNTGNQTTTYLGITSATHVYTEDSGRESIQFNGHADLRVTNVTGNVGGLETSAGLGQNNCFQLQNVKTGYLKKSIFWNFRSPAMIATNDFLFEDIFMGWYTTNREIYLQDMIANGYTKNQNVGGTITFRRVTFYCPGYTLAWLARFQDDNCNLVFEDCIFPTSIAPTIVKDERSGSPYTITIINPTFDDNPPLPTFGNPPEAAYAPYEKVVTDDHYYDRGMGYRTPEP